MSNRTLDPVLKIVLALALALVLSNCSKPIPAGKSQIQINCSLFSSTDYWATRPNSTNREDEDSCNPFGDAVYLNVSVPPGGPSTFYVYSSSCGGDHKTDTVTFTGTGQRKKANDSCVQSPPLPPIAFSVPIAAAPAPPVVNAVITGATRQIGTGTVVQVDLAAAGLGNDTHNPEIISGISENGPPAGTESINGTKSWTRMTQFLIRYTLVVGPNGSGAPYGNTGFVNNGGLSASVNVQTVLTTGTTVVDTFTVASTSSLTVGQSITISGIQSTPANAFNYSGVVLDLTQTAIKIARPNSTAPATYISGGTFQ